MDRINVLYDDLLIKILSFVPRKVAVSTSILSKRWEKLWMWVPKIEYCDYIDRMNRSLSSRVRYRDFFSKSLSLHIAPVIASLRLRFSAYTFQPEDIKPWVGMAISRCVQELSISYFGFADQPQLVLPSSLYTCKSLATLELDGEKILVDVPQKGRLPSLKTMKLGCVTYSNEDCLRLLLSYCPVLEDLVIKRDDNVKALVVIIPSLQRLSLHISGGSSSDEFVIDTPSLKYFKVKDYRDSFSYVIKHMPKLEEACIVVDKDLDEFLESISSVKRLSLKVLLKNEGKSMYPAGIVFNQLEHLKLCVYNEYWSRLLLWLLQDSPKLRVLNLNVIRFSDFSEYEGISWSNESVPKCLSKSLETFEFTGYRGRPEERDFLFFILENERRLKSTSILRSISYE